MESKHHLELLLYCLVFGKTRKLILCDPGFKISHYHGIAFTAKTTTEDQSYPGYSCTGNCGHHGSLGAQPSGKIDQVGPEWEQRSPKDSMLPLKWKWEILKMRTSISGANLENNVFLPKASSVKTKAASAFRGLDIYILQTIYCWYFFMCFFYPKVQWLFRPKEFLKVKNREYYRTDKYLLEPAVCKALFCSA